MLNYLDYGIRIDQTGASQQAVHCPQCKVRKPYKNPASATKKDLSVNLEKNVWNCHRCGWTSKGLYSGKKTKDEFEYRVIKSTAKEPVKKVYEFFATRGISKEVVDRNHIKITKRKFGHEIKDTICFNYYVGDDLVNIKYRSKDKEFQQEADAFRIFYKINDIENEEECIITEGEFDALAFEEAGYQNAISIPDGSPPKTTKNLNGKMQFLENAALYFESINKIYLALDNDGPGQRMKEELAKRLGKTRCHVVEYPKGCKDGNDVLKKYGKEGLRDCILKSKRYPISGIIYANNSYEYYKDLHENGYPDAPRTGYYDFDKKVKLHPGILTILTGIPSHGKSNFMDQLLIRLAVYNGWKTAIFSPENARIEIHMQRLAEILIGKPFTPNYNGQMSRKEADDAFGFIKNHFFWMRESDGDNSLDNYIELGKALVLRHGIRGYVIDPWNTIEHKYENQTETDYTGKALTKLLNFTREYEMSTFVVAHPYKMPNQKGSNHYEVPTPYHISGSAHWYNKPDICLSIYRQFDKDNEHTKYTSVYIQKVKNRYLGQTGFCKFGFEISNQRYYPYGDSPDYSNELEDYEQKEDAPF